MPSREAMQIADEYVLLCHRKQLARAIDELRIRDLERELSYMSYERKRLLKEINTLKAAMGEQKEQR